MFSAFSADLSWLCEGDGGAAYRVGNTALGFAGDGRDSFGHTDTNGKHHVIMLRQENTTRELFLLNVLKDRQF